MPDIVKKPVLIVLAIFVAFAVLCCGGIALFVPGAIKKVSNDFQSAEKAGTAAVLAFAKDWDINELSSRATPELAKTLTDPASTAVWNSFKTSYGAFKSGTSQIKGFNSTNSTGTGQRTEVSYENNATFENKTARLTMVLVKDGEQWKVDGLHIDGAGLGK